MARVRTVLGSLIVALLALTVVVAPPASADDAGDEAAFLVKLNDLRASKGIGTLAPNGALTSVARTWSAGMAAAGSISHNPTLASQAPSEWSRLGENVGMGMDVQGLHDAFVNSPAHYKNMADGAFTSVGIGVVRDGGGKIFVTVNFMTSKAAPAAAPVPALVAQPAPAPAPSPAPAPAPSRPAPVAAPAAVPAPAPAPVAAPVPPVAPVAEPVPAAAPTAPTAPAAAEPVPVAPVATRVTSPARRTAMVSMGASSVDSSDTALGLVGLGLLLTIVASSLVIPRRRPEAPALARR